MRIDLEAELVSPFVEDDFYYDGAPTHVSVQLGGSEVALVPVTASPSRASHGDDSSYRMTEDRRVINETLAPYIAQIFRRDS